MITLQQLISVAPFPEETKKELLESEESLSDPKKLDLMDLCWQLISQWYQTELRGRQEVATLEMALGQKTYSSDDFGRIEDEIFMELVKKFAIEEKEEDLTEVREKLAKMN